MSHYENASSYHPKNVSTHQQMNPGDEEDLECDKLLISSLDLSDPIRNMLGWLNRELRGDNADSTGRRETLRDSTSNKEVLSSTPPSMASIQRCDSSSDLPSMLPAARKMNRTESGRDTSKTIGKIVEASTGMPEGHCDSPEAPTSHTDEETHLVRTEMQSLVHPLQSFGNLLVISTLQAVLNYLSMALEVQMKEKSIPTGMVRVRWTCVS
jgi:hypothetical protein